MASLKEYDCVQVSHHERITGVIEEYQNSRWCAHTYQAQGSPTIANHYLLFEREKVEKSPASVQAVPG